MRVEVVGVVVHITPQVAGHNDFSKSLHGRVTFWHTSIDKSSSPHSDTRAVDAFVGVVVVVVAVVVVDV
jgi:hypothetical protein